jgi:hypothetical protein
MDPAEVVRLRKQIAKGERDGSIRIGSQAWMVLQRRLENLEKAYLQGSVATAQRPRVLVQKTRREEACTKSRLA